MCSRSPAMETAEEQRSNSVVDLSELDQVVPEMMPAIALKVEEVEIGNSGDGDQSVPTVEAVELSSSDGGCHQRQDVQEQYSPSITFSFGENVTPETLDALSDKILDCIAAIKPEDVVIVISIKEKH